ncbi:hypothetical protein NDU88_005241 [Pleurodeles waltl]|uniref:Uncharacterized protein n=1 Tax=Pleurodeles waltl TaxID=8319 RepID=A0AAV7L8X3_PLEWA|nr:hypothetical protein NDU88_005241 [Pleurodeles waltl]
MVQGCRSNGNRNLLPGDWSLRSTKSLTCRSETLERQRRLAFRPVSKDLPRQPTDLRYCELRAMSSALEAGLRAGSSLFSMCRTASCSAGLTVPW